MTTANKQEKSNEHHQVNNAVKQNPYNGNWEIGWESDDGEFTPALCGYATKEGAEADAPNLDRIMDKQMRDWQAEHDAAEREENERYPNLAYVRAKINKLRDSGNAADWAKSFDARSKLDALLERYLHEHISWPLPSWAAIESGRVYGR
jgi:hypothetical protein